MFFVAAPSEPSTNGSYTRLPCLIMEKIPWGSNVTKIMPKSIIYLFSPLLRLTLAPYSTVQAISPQTVRGFLCGI